MPNNPGNTNKDSGSQRDEKSNASGSQDNKPQMGSNSNGSNSSGSNSGRSNSSGDRGHQGMKQPQQPSGGASSQSLRLSLTPEQQQQIRKATGRDASSLELSVEDIEDSLGEESDSMGESSSSGESSSRGESGSSSVDDDYDDEPTKGRNSESEF